MLLRIKHTVLTVVAITVILASKLVSSSHQDHDLPCNFDEIQPKDVGKKTDVKYVKHKNGARTKRTEEELYEPIRISVFIHDLDDFVDTVEVERLEKVSRSAVSIIRKLLSVIPVSDPLLMARSEEICISQYHEGPYQGQCASISNSYIGEQCLDDFLIPDDHLQGYWIYDDRSLSTGQPTEYYSDGSGIPNTDTVLYVKKQHTPQCDRKPDIVAYASYCKLDQTNRPIAGVINFCPDHLQDETYDEDKFIVLTVHEIFHVLGFSCNLFGQFKDCSTSYSDSETGCLVAIPDSYYQYRLITPAVQDKTRQQFGCQAQEYSGGPLENMVTTSCKYSSHWEARFMSGSIMAPTIGKPHETFIDRMTLAVFEDSGWYQVNYDNAEDLPWGKDQGCHFGSTNVCTTEESQFFCNSSGSSGCHFLHRDKGTCSTNDFLDECYTYQTDNLGQCSTETNQELPTTDGEFFHPDSRCYVSNLIHQGGDPCNPVGRCYLTRCNLTSELYEIKVGDGPWSLCPNGSAVSIPGYEGKVMCPSFERICGNTSSILDLVDPCCPTTLSPTPTSSVISTTLLATTMIQSLCVSMEFGELEYEQVEDQEKQGIFKDNVKKSVCDTTQLMKNQVASLEVGEEQMAVTVTFDINNEDGQMANENMISVAEAYQDLETAVISMTFSVFHMGVNYTATSIRIVDSFSVPSSIPSTTHFTKIDTRSHRKVGIAVGIMLGIVVGLFVVACICCKKKSSNAVGPAPDDTAEMHTSPRSGTMYIVSEADGSSGKVKM